MTSNQEPDDSEKGKIVFLGDESCDLPIRGCLQKKLSSCACGFNFFADAFSVERVDFQATQTF